MPEKCPLWFRLGVVLWRVYFSITRITALNSPSRARQLGWQFSLIFLSFSLISCYFTWFSVREASGSSGLLSLTVFHENSKEIAPEASSWSSGPFLSHFLIKINKEIVPEASGSSGLLFCFIFFIAKQRIPRILVFVHKKECFSCFGLPGAILRVCAGYAPTRAQSGPRSTQQRTAQLAKHKEIIQNQRKE